MKDVVMVIPGAEAQKPLIKKIQDMGYNVVCVNPDTEASGYESANIGRQGDILDKEFCLEVAKEQNAIAVLSDECDIAMPTVAYVSEKMGLKSIGVEQAALYTNKYLMRKFSEEIGMPYPKYRQCATVKEACEFFESLSVRKMIMKPLDSNSSRGVYTVTSIDEIEYYFVQALAYSKVDSAVLCEEYIEGTEFTVDGIVKDGKHYSLAISKKKHYEHNPNIACELYFSSKDETFDYEKLKKQNDTYVEKSGLPLGFTHAEYKFDGKQFVLIEIGARGGGNFISSHIVPLLSGIDTYEILVQSVINEENCPEISFQVENSKCAVLRFFDIEGNEGRVASIEGEEVLKNTPEIIMYQFRCEVGQVIKKAENDSARVGFYIAVAKDKQRLDDVMKLVRDSVMIRLEGV